MLSLKAYSKKASCVNKPWYPKVSLEFKEPHTRGEITEIITYPSDGKNSCVGLLSPNWEGMITCLFDKKLPIPKVGQILFSFGPEKVFGKRKVKLLHGGEKTIDMTKKLSLIIAIDKKLYSFTTKKEYEKILKEAVKEPRGEPRLNIQYKAI